MSMRSWIAGLSIVGALTIAFVASLANEPAAAAPNVTLTPVELAPTAIEPPPPRELPRVAEPQAKKPRRARRSATTSIAPPPPIPNIPTPPNPSPTDLDAPLPH